MSSTLEALKLQLANTRLVEDDMHNGFIDAFLLVGTIR